MELIRKPFARNNAKLLSSISKSNTNVCLKQFSSTLYIKNKANNSKIKNALTSNNHFSTSSLLKKESQAEEASQTASSAYADSSIDEKEISKFKVLANSWWTENGEFEGLHRMNRLRVPLIRDAMVSYLDTMPKSEKEKLVNQFNESNKDEMGKVSGFAEPLRGLNILDIGCGGGILSEALARLGAQVTGIDACKENVLAAQMRIQSEFEKSKENARYCKRLRYLHCTVEDLAVVDENSNYFDGVVMSEVVEHVSNVKSFMENSAKLLKNQGYLFATTINRTAESYMLGIVAAEYLLNIVTKGTHDWNKFIKPSELKQHFRENDVSVRFEMGMFYNPLTKTWSWSRLDGINYAIYGQKQKTTIH